MQKLFSKKKLIIFSNILSVVLLLSFLAVFSPTGDRLRDAQLLIAILIGSILGFILRNQKDLKNGQARLENKLDLLLKEKVTSLKK